MLGYTDKLTVRPRENIEFKISAAGHIPYTAQLVRLINGDIRSLNPRFKEIEIDSPINGKYEGREQSVSSGSCVVVEDAHRLDGLDELTIVVNLMPTTPLHGKQHVIGRWDRRAKAGWSLCIEDNGRLAFTASSGSENASTLAVGQPLKAGIWYTCAVRVSWVSKSVELDCNVKKSFQPHLEFANSHAATHELGQRPNVLPPLLIAAAYGGRAPDGRVIPVECFNGRLEAPVIYQGLLSDDEIAKVMAGERPPLLRDRLVADWDFADGISTARISDRSSNALHGHIHNLPLRGVKGSRWDGSTMEWRHAPDQYAAIHFHSDDLYDCGWLTDITYQIADGLRSGIYALRLRPWDEDRLNSASEIDEEYIPFFVAPAKGRPQSKLAFIVPTYTYAAYGNVGALESRRKLSGRSEEQYYERAMTGPGTREYALLIEEHRDLGLSLYDCHTDGSPVHLSSWRRPLLTMRPKSLLWTFCADLLLIDWLEARSFDYDVITDDLLQDEGVGLLNDYSVVMTGNHPEYQTTRQLDAIEAYLGRGGRLMYMGGNGYYWRSAVHEELSGVIEVRRGLTGTGTWQSEVGESCLAFSGEMGGIWRDLGRPPQRLFGVGFIAEGADASHYRITPGARQSRAAFILEGVEGDIIGDFGIFGGAAGQEIDKTNNKWGTPAHAVVLARSESHGPKMLYVIEEMISTVPLIDTYRPLTCAEVVFFETRNGGAVFSVGSMAWCGSLSHDNFDNDVSRITENVLRRFMSQEPFELELSTREQTSVRKSSAA